MQKNRRPLGWWGLLAAAALLAGGCDGPLGEEFRNAAGDSIQSGIMSLLTGVVDGAFAVYEPGNDAGNTV